MDIRRVLKKLKDRVGFYLYENREDIPSSPGMYGWFVPLWLASQDIEEFTQIINAYFDYEPGDTEVSTKSAIVKFNWYDTKLEVSKAQRRTHVNDKVRASWEQMLQSPEDKEAFKTALMEATIFLPPLYVGKANNLRARHAQHVRSAENSEKNSFGRRFQEFADSNPLVKLGVEDLLFVCITFDERHRSTLSSDNNLNKLLESVLMKIICPPFSER
tara:strand:+ start:129 stop:776 length:648 start_codon:yes stop_codon:yes gene_type:complete